MDDSEWRRVFDINLDAVLIASQIVGRQMAARKTGSIVNIGSISGFIVNRPQWHSPYGVSKAAVHHLTKSLAAEWASKGVRVNAIAPGYVKTEIASVEYEDYRHYWKDEVPMQRYATPMRSPRQLSCSPATLGPSLQVRFSSSMGATHSGRQRATGLSEVGCWTREGRVNESCQTEHTLGRRRIRIRQQSRPGRQSMKPGYLIGLDYGTLSARGVLVDAITGRAEASHTYAYRHGVMNETLPDGAKCRRSGRYRMRWTIPKRPKRS